MFSFSFEVTFKNKGKHFKAKMLLTANSSKERGKKKFVFHVNVKMTTAIL